MRLRSRHRTLWSRAGGRYLRGMPMENGPDRAETRDYRDRSAPLRRSRVVVSLAQGQGNGLRKRSGYTRAWR
jgi:hypothetical protein